jgi:predicted transcriptional regulator
MQKLNIGAPTISHHLKELSNAGLIKTEKSGKFLVAHINRELLAELKKAFDIEN